MSSELGTEHSNQAACPATLTRRVASVLQTRMRLIGMRSYATLISLPLPAFLPCPPSLRTQPRLARTSIPHNIFQDQGTKKFDISSVLSTSLLVVQEMCGALLGNSDNTFTMVY